MDYCFRHYQMPVCKVEFISSVVEFHLVVIGLRYTLANIIFLRTQKYLFSFLMSYRELKPTLSWSQSSQVQ